VGPILIKAATLRRNERAARNESVENLDCGGQQPSRIASQVPDESLHPLLLERGKGSVELMSRCLLEARHAEVADASLRIEHSNIVNALDDHRASHELATTR